MLKNKLLKLLALFFIILCLDISSAFSQIEFDNEEIEIDSTEVILNAIITDDKGNARTDLNKNQFEIYEDGIKQEISYFSKQETSFAAVILLDSSGSMEKRVSLARSATIKFLEGIRAGDNVAIYSFDSKVNLLQDFSNLRDIVPQIYNLKSSGMTVLNDAVVTATKALQKRKEKRKAIVILSDGADNKSSSSTKKALKLAINSNIIIYTVDMSSKAVRRQTTQQHRALLKKFAKKTGAKFIQTPAGRQLRKAFKSVIRDLRTQYTFGYHPKNLKKDGNWRKIKLKLTNKDLNVRTREGYYARKK